MRVSHGDTVVFVFRQALGATACPLSDDGAMRKQDTTNPRTLPVRIQLNATFLDGEKTRNGKAFYVLQAWRIALDILLQAVLMVTERIRDFRLRQQLPAFPHVLGGGV